VDESSTVVLCTVGFFLLFFGWLDFGGFGLVFLGYVQPLEQENGLNLQNYTLFHNNFS